MELTPSQKKTVRHQFDSFCKKVLREEARDYAKHIAWLSEHEVSLSELSEEQINRAYTLDEYPSDYVLFNVHGYSVIVHNERLAHALAGSSDEKRDILLLSYFLDMTDGEIADNMSVISRRCLPERCMTKTAYRICAWMRKCGGLSVHPRGKVLSV